MKKIVLLIVILFTVELFSAPQIKAVASAAQSTVGVEIEYTLEIASHLRDYTIAEIEKKYFTDASKDIPLYIISDIKDHEVKEGDTFVRTIQMKIVYLMTGEYSLPPIQIIDKDKLSLLYEIPTIQIESISKNVQKEDIEPPLTRSGNYTRIVLLTIAVLLLAVLIFFIIRVIKRWRGNVPQNVSIDPEIRFMKDYHKLIKKDLLEKNEIEGFCIELSYLFRRYLDDSFRMGALDLTTDEIFKVSTNFNISQENALEIKKIMYLWDLAKFAEMRPTREIIEQNVASTLALVKSGGLGGKHGL